MRATLALAAGLVAAGLSMAAPGTAPAAEAGMFDADTAVKADDLDGNRGGTDAGSTITGSVVQGNQSDLSGTNTGNVSVGSGGAKTSGTISQAQVIGNHGITSLMQNTGDLVNINNATSVNVYMR